MLSNAKRALQKAPGKAVLLTAPFTAAFSAPFTAASKREHAQVVGRHGLGVRNNAKNHLVQFCQQNNFTIANTLFTQLKRRLYTSTAPNGLHRNHIHLILCQQQAKSSITAAKVLGHTVDLTAHCQRHAMQH